MNEWYEQAAKKMAAALERITQADAERGARLRQAVKAALEQMA